MSSMEEKATQRVPVEIWTVILRRAVATSIFPYIDDSYGLDYGIIQNTLFYRDDDCEAYCECLMMQRTIGTLRLVCRLWASILLNYPICVFTDFGSCNYPGKSLKSLEGAERIRVIAPQTFCPCKIWKNTCFFDLSFCDSLFQHEPGWWEDLENEKLKNALRTVQMLSLEFDGREFEMEKLIAMMPKLRALRIQLYDLDPTRDFTPLLSCQSSLTNLELHALTWTSFSRRFPPLNSHLQSLQYLYLHFYWDKKRSPLVNDISWNFPRLKALGVSGEVDHGVKEEVVTFLRQCGPSLMEFADLISFRGADKLDLFPEISQEDHFPRLHIYGTDMRSIYWRFDRAAQVERTFPRKARSLALLELNLEFYSTDVSWQLLTYMRQRGFDEVIILKRWSDMKALYGEERPFLSYFFGEFTEVVKTDLKFFDVEGIEIRDPRCGRFWEQKSCV
ncbi:hypothetical protein CPB86DRAFT_876590 [Serendipita vermifera]|nr:hypothetical protein CPB86DRAFT_876590 [Serendipita vermifera]